MIARSARAPVPGTMHAVGRAASTALAVRPAAVYVLFGVALAFGIAASIAPHFRWRMPQSAGGDFVNHVAIVAAAADTIRATRALPISTDQIVHGVEYPYFLFQNAGFHIVAALISVALGIPPYLGAGALLALAFVIGAVGTFVLATRAGVHHYLAVALALMYAGGPYLSVNLLVRTAFPEYVTWQLAPALLLAVGHAIRPTGSTWAVLLGALALAAPFYLHKLTAPHLAGVLVLLALNGSALNRRTIAPIGVRLAVVGVVALCLSVPAWYPALRGLEGHELANTPAGAPMIHSLSWADLFWPRARNSLPEFERYGFYGDRFALHVGLVPTLGMLASVAALATRPRTAPALRLILPLVIFGTYVLLLRDGFGIWSFIPKPLKYVQFTYRLLGVTHLVGFVLLIAALGATANLTGRVSSRVRRAAAVLFVVLGMLSTISYWQPSPLSNHPSAAIEPRNLAESRFYPWAYRSNLPTRQATLADGRLAIPPVPVVVPAQAASVVVAGEAPQSVLQASREPLIVRIYGFSQERSGARIDTLTGVFSPAADRPYPVEPIRELIEAERAKLAHAAAPADWPTPLPGGWRAVRLAEATVDTDGKFLLRASLGAPIDAFIEAIAVECSRATKVPDPGAGGSSSEPTCVTLEYLAIPNERDRFVRPEPLAPSRIGRGPYGAMAIDARGLGPGHYLLPTFDYPFVRVRGEDGALIPTYQFGGQTAIRHLGAVPSYSIGYDLTPELLALGFGLGMFVLYASASSIARARRGRAYEPAGRRAGGAKSRA